MKLHRIAPLVLLLVLGVMPALAQPQPMPRFPTGNLLENPGFEYVDTSWTVANTNGKDTMICNSIGQNSDCAFYFKGGNYNEATILKQVVTLPPTTSTQLVRVSSSFSARSLGGASCLAVVVKVTFNNPNKPAAKKKLNTCNVDGQPMNFWVESGTFYMDGVFVEKKIKKIAFVVKHTGIGAWYFDNPQLQIQAAAS